MLPSNNFLDIRITMSMMVKMVMGRLLWWWWPSMLPSILSQDILIWWSRLRGPFWVKKHAEMKWNFSWRRCWTLKRSTSAMITNYLRIQWEAESSTASYVYFTHLEMANLNNLKSSLCSEFLTLKCLSLTEVPLDKWKGLWICFGSEVEQIFRAVTPFRLLLLFLYPPAVICPL